MLYPLDHPVLILVGSLLTFWTSARIGSSLSAERLAESFH
jgi:hypothetical protein